MPAITLTEAELRELVTMDEAALSRVEDGFRRLAAGDVEMPPIQSLKVPEAHGEVDIKSAYVRGWESFAVKISSGFFDNPSRGLPSGSGLMVLLSSETGVPQAVLLDNGYLTHVRTGLAGAVAARLLAPEQVETVAVFGAGDQARYQVRAVAMVRSPRRVLVHARNQQRAAACARELGEILGIEARAVTSPEEAVREAQVVVTTTPATSPILRAEWLHPGLHITAMGSDAPDKQELEVGVLAQADVVVCDRRSQARRLGELRAAQEAGAVNVDDVPELGEVLAGEAVGRTGPEQVSVCDLTGTGVQDTAIARFALERARSIEGGATS